MLTGFSMPAAIIVAVLTTSFSFRLSHPTSILCSEKTLMKGPCMRPVSFVMAVLLLVGAKYLELQSACNACIQPL